MPEKKSGNVISGVTTMAAATSLRIGIQIAILPVIGRLLGPQAYGQIALVSPFVLFAMLLSASGLSTCILRARTITEDMEGTLFCFSAGFSIFLMMVFAALAYPLGRFLGEPRFPLLLIAMSAILPISAFSIVPAGLLLRARKYDWIALSDIASAMAGICAVITGICLGLGVWSLVMQQLTLWACKAAIMIKGSGARPHLTFRWPILRENWQFGGKLTGVAVATFIAGNIDNILIGAFLGTEALGFYALAFQLVGLPHIVLSGSVYNTLLAGISETQQAGGDARAPFLKNLHGIMLICLPAMTGFAATAPLLVPLVMGTGWLQTARLIQLLVPLGIVQLFGIAIAAFLAGIGRPGLSLKLTLTSAGLTVIAIVVGVCFSTDAVAAGVSATSFAGLCIALYTLATACDIAFAVLWRAVAAPVISSVVMLAGVLVLRGIMPVALSLAAQIFICIVAGLGMYGSMLFLFFREQLAADIADIKMAFNVRKTRV